MAILTNYTKLIEKQVEIDESFRERDGKLNGKELTYYLEVSTRILKKLADIK